MDTTDIQIDSTKLNQDSVKLTADTIKENLNHVEVSKDLASGLNNITKDLGIIKAVSTNNVNTLHNHTTLLNVILQHFLGKGQSESFMDFLVNIYKYILC
jgi:hypothetical protein